MKLAAIAGISIFLFSLAAPPAQAADSAAAVLARQAHSLEVKGRLDLAAQSWRRVLLAEPDNADALAGLARIAKSNGDLAEAERQLNRLRAVQPNYPELRRIESMKVLVNHKSDLDRALRLAAEQQYEAAMEIYRGVFGSEPVPGSWAIAYYETAAGLPGGWDGAVSGLRGLTTEFPGVQEYQLSLGRVLSYRPATRAEGLRMLEAINGDETLVIRARQAWRQALVWQGPSPASIQSLNAYLERYPDPEMETLRTQAQSAQGPAAQPGRREEEFGFEALKANKLAEAEELFQKAQRLWPGNPGPLSGLGFVRMKQDRFADAIPFFEEALARRTNDKVIQEALDSARFFNWTSKADAAFQGGFFDQAATFYGRAIEARPDSADALRGKAGALMRLHRMGEAAVTYERLTQIDPRDAQAWKSLLRARYQSGGSSLGWAAYQRMPETIRIELDGDLDHLIVLASIYDDLNRRAEFDQVFKQLIEVAGAADTRLSTDQRMELGGLLLKVGRFNEAATEFEAVVAVEPESAPAWDGLLAALAQSGNDVRSLAVLGRMPDAVYRSALERPGFLLSAASIYRSAGRLSDAAEFLKRALAASGGDENERSRLQAKLQLARIWIEQGNPAPGERMLRQLSTEQNDNPEIWIAFLSALHETGRDAEVVAEAQRIPAVVITRLLNDPKYVALMAAVHNSRGEYAQGLRLVRQGIAALQAEKKSIEPELQIQLSWLLLNSEGDPRELYSLLREGVARRDLTKQQRENFEQIWSIWSRRSAQEAVAAGDPQRAVSILSAALRMLPEDNDIYSSLAGTLIKTNQQANALVVYKVWGLKDANAMDYAGAIGSAMTVNDRKQTSLWIREALVRFPNDAQLLTLAGKDAAMRGEYDKAESYWKAALQAMPASEPLSMTNGGGPPAAADQLGALLLGGRPPGVDSGSPEALGQLLTGASFSEVQGQPSVRLPANSGDRGNATATWSVDDDRTSSNPVRRPGSTVISAVPATPQVAAPSYRDSPAMLGPQIPLAQRDRSSAAPWTEPQQMALVEPVRPAKSARDEVEDQIAAIETRNTPYISSVGRMRTRSGRSGLETLTSQEAEVEASATLGEKFRLSLVGRPVFLDAGTPEADSVLRFGLAPLGADIGSQSASGTAAEIQLSGETLGLKIGMTPNGFLVRNPTFGLRLRPGGGPVTALFERDSIKDTLLSYAGTRDPVSHQIWGGVVSDSMTLQGNWGDEDTGFYAQVGYQRVTGERVAKNEGMNGGAGAYWKLLTLPDGSLKMGLNFFTMHYDKNLRFFTLGHGGYFSPQRYFLFNIPVEWNGTWHDRLDYTIAGSLGSQHMQEDSAPYFPTDAILQGRNGPVYPALSATGAHYNIDMTGSYRVAPRWVIGGFLQLNNARNYTSQSAGFYLRYLFHEQPMFRSLDVPTLPDWRGQRPLGLR